MHIVQYPFLLLLKIYKHRSNSTLIDYGNEKDNESHLQYRNGDEMILTIVHDLTFTKMKYIIRLLKVKQNDVEILYQIIDDLNDKIKRLESKNEQSTKESTKESKLIIGSWKTNGTLENSYVYVFSCFDTLVCAVYTYIAFVGLTRHKL